MARSDAPLAFVDVETTGLDPTRHDVYEIAIIRPDTQPAEVRLWIEGIDLAAADPTALRISRYYQRRAELLAANDQAVMVRIDREPFCDAKSAATGVAELTAGRHLVGINPAFDATFLERLLRRNGFAPAWHYHLVDLLALAAGHLRLRPPWRSDALAETLGVTVPDSDRHTALGDARMARDMYRAIMGGDRGPL